MSKTYIVSRNGGTVSKAPVNDNKIPIYANETALDADLANIPDNTLVATRGGHDDVIDQMKAYIRNQNVLSEWEDITIGTSSDTATEMKYDGYIEITNYNASLWLSVNGILFGAGGPWGSSFIVPIKKGDVVYGPTPGGWRHTKVAYYKLRDYIGR